MKEWLTNNIIYLITALSLYLSPIGGAMLAVGALIIIDAIFGIIASKKKGEEITSKRMSETLIKMFVYQLLIITGHIIATTLVAYIPFVTIVLTFIAIVEFYSIGEKFTIITGLPFLKYLRNMIFKTMKNQDLRDLMNDENKDS